MQAEAPAFDAGFFGSGSGGLFGIIRQAGQHGFVGDDFGESVGGVEDVFRELGGEAGELFHDRLEARLLVFR